MNVHLMKSNVLSDIICAPSVHDAVLLLQDKIKLAMEACIPKMIHNGRKMNQWVTLDLVNLFKAKQKAYRKWKTHLSSRNLSLYKSAENKFLHRSENSILMLSETVRTQLVFGKP